jgi:hypothetical protein
MTRRLQHPAKATGNPNQLPIDWNAPKDDVASSVSGTTGQPPPPPPEDSPATQPVAMPPTAQASRRPRSKASSHADRIIARLPVPKPQSASVAAGHFGRDEDGDVIRPEADEIRAITESLADRLVELLDAMNEVKQESARQTMQEQFTQAVAMYALEFGERPARQLEAYARRQASLDSSPRPRGRWENGKFR